MRRMTFIFGVALTAAMLIDAAISDTTTPPAPTSTIFQIVKLRGQVAAQQAEITRLTSSLSAAEDELNALSAMHAENVAATLRLRGEVGHLTGVAERYATLNTQLDQANNWLYIFLIDRSIIKPQTGWDYCLERNAPDITSSGFCSQYDLDRDGDFDQDDVGLGQRCNWCRVGSKAAMQIWLGSAYYWGDSPP